MLILLVGRGSVQGLTTPKYVVQIPLFYSLNPLRVSAVARCETLTLDCVERGHGLLASIHDEDASRASHCRFLHVVIGDWPVAVNEFATLIMIGYSKLNFPTDWTILIPLFMNDWRVFGSFSSTLGFSLIC